MTLTTLLKSVPAFVVLVVAAEICPGDPPILVDPNDVARLGAPQHLPIDFTPLPPRVADYSRSGCLDDPNDPWFPPCGGDEIELVVEGNALHVLHRNATYNCCPDDIVISLTVEDDLIMLM